MGDFSFFQAENSQIEGGEPVVKSTEVEKILPEPPAGFTLPKRITKTWVETQLPPSTWNRLSKANQCTPQNIALMAEAARRTPSRRAILGRAGLTLMCWTRWERRAMQGEQPFLLWHQVMVHALSQLEDELVDAIRGHAVTDWKAAAWLLPRVNREEWSDPKQGSTTVNIKGDNETKVTINTMNDQDALEVARIMNEVGALPVLEGEVVEGDDSGTGDVSRA